MDYERTLKILSKWEGKDKLLRTASYAIAFLSPLVNDAKSRERLLMMGKEISTARVVVRRLGSLPTLDGALKLVATIGKTPDTPDHILRAAIACIYSVFFPVEDVAWLSRHGVLSTDPTWWAVATTVVWLAALLVAILKLVYT